MITVHALLLLIILWYWDISWLNVNMKVITGIIWLQVSAFSHMQKNPLHRWNPAVGLVHFTRFSNEFVPILVFMAEYVCIGHHYVTHVNFNFKARNLMCKLLIFYVRFLMIISTFLLYIFYVLHLMGLSLFNSVYYAKSTNPEALKCFLQHCQGYSLMVQYSCMLQGLHMAPFHTAFFHLALWHANKLRNTIIISDFCIDNVAVFPAFISLQDGVMSTRLKYSFRSECLFSIQILLFIAICKHNKKVNSRLHQVA